MKTTRLWTLTTALLCSGLALPPAAAWALDLRADMPTAAPAAAPLRAATQAAADLLTTGIAGTTDMASPTASTIASNTEAVTAVAEPATWHQGALLPEPPATALRSDATGERGWMLSLALALVASLLCVRWRRSAWSGSRRLAPAMSRDAASTVVAPLRRHRSDGAPPDAAPDTGFNLAEFDELPIEVVASVDSGASTSTLVLPARKLRRKRPATAGTAAAAAAAKRRPASLHPHAAVPPGPAHLATGPAMENRGAAAAATAVR